jgi:hypothetical protein
MLSPFFEGLRELGSELFDVFGFALPNSKNKPALLAQQCNIFLVAPDVRFEFVLPVFDSAFGGACFHAAWVPMPEATVDEDCRPPLGENKIWRSWQLFLMEAES